MRRSIRITLDFDHPVTSPPLIEYSVQREPGLTQAEQYEFDALAKELSDVKFSDFQKAELLKDADRKLLSDKKKRLEILRMIESEGRFEYIPLEAKEQPKTVVLIIRPDQQISYVENMPTWMIDKLFEKNVAVNVNPTVTVAPYAGGGGVPVATTPVATPQSMEEEYPEEANITYDKPKPPPVKVQGTPNEQKVINVLNAVKGVYENNTGWGDLVTVKEETAGLVYIRPKAFMKNAWKPINEDLKTAFGNIWKSVGKGDKDAHWVANFR
jgi:hypothetical protein